jgi:hypothetical protein
MDALMARALEAGLADLSSVKTILSEAYSGKELDDKVNYVMFAMVFDDVTKVGDCLSYISNPQTRDDFIDAAISTWIREDSKLVVSTIESQLTDYTRTKALGRIVLYLCSTGIGRVGDPESASDVLLLMPKGQERTDALSEIVRLRAAQDGLKALEWTESLEGGERREAEFAVIRQCGNRLSIDELVTATNQLADTRARSWAASNAARRLAETDLNAAIQWVEALPEDVKSSAKSMLVATMARGDIDGATKYALDGAAGNVQVAPLQAVLTAITRREPKEAGPWLLRLPPEAQKDLAGSVAFQWYHAAPDSAVAWANTLPAGTLRDSLFLAMSNGTGDDREARIRLINQIGDAAMRERCLRAVERRR